MLDHYSSHEGMRLAPRRSPHCTLHQRESVALFKGPSTRIANISYLQKLAAAVSARLPARP